MSLLLNCLTLLESPSWSVIASGSSVVGMSFNKLLSESGSIKFWVCNWTSDAYFAESAGGEYRLAPAR